MINDKYNSYRRYTEINQESRWASIDEIKGDSTHISLKDKKYKTAGIPLISDGQDAWVDGEDTHTLIFGATGSKKTRLFVMPSICMMIKAGESFIATDPKGELYDKTAGLAEANGYKIKVLNFRDIGKGEMWNPLDYPYELFHRGKTDKATALLNDFMEALAYKQSVNNKDPFWVDSAKAFGIASMLLLMEAETIEEVNVTSLANICQYGKLRKIAELVRRMDPASACAVNYNGIIQCAEATMKSVMIEVFSMISLFLTQKDLSAMLSRNTFNIKDFGKEKTAFYIIVPDEKTSTHLLVTTFVKQAYEMLIEQAQKEAGGKLKIRVNFVLDEFCNVPRIPDMPTMISAARSRNIRYFLVAQSSHQLKSRYDVDAETIKGNCVNWVFLTSKELSLLEEIRDLCGEYTLSDGRTRHLISTSELQRLNKDAGETLILHDRCYPIITEIADINDYEDFKGFKTPEIPAFKLPDVKILDLSDMYVRSVLHQRNFPFAKEEDKISESKIDKNRRYAALLVDKMDDDPRIAELIEEYSKQYPLD